MFTLILPTPPTPLNTLTLPVALAGKSLNNSRNVLVSEEEPCCCALEWDPLGFVRTNFTKLWLVLICTDLVALLDVVMVVTGSDFGAPPPAGDETDDEDAVDEPEEDEEAMPRVDVAAGFKQLFFTTGEELDERGGICVGRFLRAMILGGLRREMPVLPRPESPILGLAIKLEISTWNNLLPHFSFLVQKAIPFFSFNNTITIAKDMCKCGTAVWVVFGGMRDKLDEIPKVYPIGNCFMFCYCCSLCSFCCFQSLRSWH